jgi:xylan 1,4-beta-xylosidase
MKYKAITLSLGLTFGSICALFAQNGTNFTIRQIDSIKNSCDSVSGPGKKVIGNGGGGWRSGSDGVMYSGAYPMDKRWRPMDASFTTGSVVKDGLLPPIKPLLELHLRDTEMCLGGDGYYYMTGSSGDNIWAYAAGAELWRSKDLKKWTYLGVVWSIEKDGTWEKKWQNLHGKPARALWAPEIHYVKGNYFICFSMPPTGITILKSTTGKAEGPYVKATAITDRPFVNGIDPTLFQDDDGKVYFTYAGANRIALMKDDLSDIAEPWHPVVLSNPDHDPTHHAARCAGRGMNDFGTEGAILFKANGKYYLGAADDYQGRYSSCVAVADNIFGPYHNRQETVPSGGGTGFFKDKNGNWWCTYFGNDSQSPWREKPGMVKVDFDADGKISVSKHQPFVDDPAWK